MPRRHGWLAAQAIVTVLLLTFLLRSLDLAALRALFVRLPLWFYLGSLAVILAGQTLYAWRWKLLLRAAGVQVSFGIVLRQYFIGLFINNFLPSTVGGDLAKVYYLGRDHGYRVVTASIVLDRILGIGLLAMFACIALWWRSVLAPSLAAAHVAVGAVAAVSVVLLVLVAAGSGGLPERVAPLGTTAVDFARRLQRLRLDMSAPLANPGVLIKAAFVVAAYFLAITAVYLSFIMLLEGAAPPFVMVFGVVTATSVLSNLPISLNGLGLREQLHAVLLAPLGVSREVAVAISLLLFGHMLVGSLIGMVFWLWAPIAPAEVAAGLKSSGPFAS
jgi:uncharacterized protein (TIRG00374 family)